MQHRRHHRLARISRQAEGDSRCRFGQNVLRPLRIGLDLLPQLPRVRLPMVEPSAASKSAIREAVALLCAPHSRHVVAKPEPNSGDSAWSALAAVSPVASLRAFAERLG